jgi:hypothetical protein
MRVQSGRLRTLLCITATLLAVLTHAKQETLVAVSNRLAKVNSTSDIVGVQKDVQTILLRAGFTIWKTDRTVVSKPANAHGIAFTEAETKSIAHSLQRGVRIKFSNIASILDYLGEQLGTTSSLSPKVRSWLSMPVGSKGPRPLQDVAGAVQALSSARGSRDWPFAGVMSEADALQNAIIMRVVTEELLSQLHDPDLLSASIRNTLFASIASPLFEETNTYSTGYEPGLLGDLVKLWESVPGGKIVLKAAKMEFGAAQASVIMLIGAGILERCYPEIVSSSQGSAKSYQLVRSRTKAPGAKVDLDVRYVVNQSAATSWVDDHRFLLESMNAQLQAATLSPVKNVVVRWSVGDYSGKQVVSPAKLFQGGAESTTDAQGVAKLTVTGLPQTEDLSSRSVIPKLETYYIDAVADRSSDNQTRFARSCLEANGIVFRNQEVAYLVGKLLETARWDEATCEATSAEESFKNYDESLNLKLFSTFLPVEGSSLTDQRNYTNPNQTRFRSGETLEALGVVSELDYSRSFSKVGRHAEQIPGNSKTFEGTGWFNSFATDDFALAKIAVTALPKFEVRLQYKANQWVALVDFGYELNGKRRQSLQDEFSPHLNSDSTRDERVTLPETAQGSVEIPVSFTKSGDGAELFKGSVELTYPIYGFKTKMTGQVRLDLVVRDYQRAKYKK